MKELNMELSDLNITVVHVTVRRFHLNFSFFLLFSSSFVSLIPHSPFSINLRPILVSSA